MSSLTTRTILGAAAVAAVGVVFVSTLPIATGLLTTAAVIAAAGYVAFTAQSARFRDEDRLVYRPVYVRSRRVHRPVRSFED